MLDNFESIYYHSNILLFIDAADLELPSTKTE